MRTENLAILLTDIKGYTARTSAQTREESRSYLLKHETVVMPVIRGFGGTRRKGVGDAILATFPSPTNALLAAMAVQDRLWRYNQRVDEEDRLEIRAVLTQGEVRVVDQDVLGEAVTIVTKLDSTAGAGEIVFSEALYLAMNKVEVPSRELGLRQLPGLPEPLRLYRVAQKNEPEQPPYGGRALSLLKDLPRIDAEWIRSVSRDPRGALGRELSAVQRRRRIPARWVAAAATMLALVALVTLWRATRSPLTDIEDAIEAGELERARGAITAYLAEHPERSADAHYLKGRIATKEEKPEQAAAHFQRAITADPSGYQRHPRIREEMELALESDACGVRSEAAKTLGVLADPGARAALEAALERERAQSSFLSGLFCRFDSHAREALKKLE